MKLRPTIQLRLTGWFAGLVLVGGAILLVASFLLAEHHIDTYPAQVNSLADRLAGVPRVRSAKDNHGRSLAQLPNRSELQAQTAQERRARNTAEQQVGVSTKRSLVFEMLGLLAGFALVAVATGFFVTRRAMAPVARITSAARRVADGSLGERLRLEEPDDELKELGDTFDEMLDRIEQALARERAFIANASHELRTPLAIIRAETDAARSYSGSLDAATARSFEVIEGAVDRSGRLLQSLFALARASRAPTARTPVDLPELVDAALRERKPALDAVGLSVQSTLATALVVGDPTLLSQLVDNLVDNAVRYSERDGGLLVVTGRDGRWATLRIENGGPELSEADVGRLTEAFARGDEGPDDAGGLGIGLTLVESIVDAHAGALELAPLPSGGLRAVVRLPAADLSAQDPPAAAVTGPPRVDDQREAGL
jgi:signal transduction histidine kinase